MKQTICRPYLINMFGFVFVLCAFALCSKNTILPSAHKQTFSPSPIYRTHPSSLSFSRLRTSYSTGGLTRSKTRRRSKPSADRAAIFASANLSSLPVNIPDWLKILRDEYKDNRRGDSVDYDDVDSDNECENGVRVPPHEFLARQMARTRIASFSVHEGVGRTLKGRDLSRVRNAIWEKTGFQD
jgi:hypothetical protein